VAIGKSILSGKSADPALKVSTQAFVAEIEAVAPSAVRPSWQVLGPVILQIASSGATLPTGSVTSASANLAAATAINNDSKANCHLDLSSVVAGH
jgi:hypothetical protein